VLHIVPHSSEGETVVDHVDEALAITLAATVALSISSVRMRQALEFQAVRDPLSGLFNRRYMEEVLGRELRRSVRHVRPLSFLLLDVDQFKAFNDTYGHDAADELIRELARLLVRNVRAEDVPCRYGGDEMVVILPDTPLEGALKKAAVLSEEVAKMQAHFLGELLPPVTVQIGVSSYPEQGDSAAAIFRAADQALLQAKLAVRSARDLGNLDLTREAQPRPPAWPQRSVAQDKRTGSR